MKKEAAELNMNVKTDIEILSDILKNFHENYKFMEKWCSLEEHNLISMFDDLENLLHQVDNAIEFSKQNGYCSLSLVLEIFALLLLYRYFKGGDEMFLML